LRSKSQRSRSLGTKNLKNQFFSRISSSNVDRFTPNQDVNDQRPILHMSSNRFNRRNCLVLFVIFVCNKCPGGPPVAATAWPLTHLLAFVCGLIRCHYISICKQQNQLSADVFRRGQLHPSSRYTELLLVVGVVVE